jgi:hypothetical protein
MKILLMIPSQKRAALRALQSIKSWSTMKTIIPVIINLVMTNRNFIGTWKIRPAFYRISIGKFLSAIAMNWYPLIFLFLIILLNLWGPMSTTITPKIEINFVLITGERSEIIDMKTHVSWVHHKLENPFRDLLWSKINRSATNGCLQKKSNWLLRKPELAPTKRRQEDEIMTARGRTRDRLTKTSFDCNLNSHSQRKIETLKIHGGKERTCT